MNPQMLKLFGFTAAADLLTGAVVALIGVWQEITELTVIGVAMLLGGALVLAVVIWQRNKPTAL